MCCVLVACCIRCVRVCSRPLQVVVLGPVSLTSLRAPGTAHRIPSPNGKGPNRWRPGAGVGGAFGSGGGGLNGDDASVASSVVSSSSSYTSSSSSSSGKMSRHRPTPNATDAGLVLRTVEERAFVADWTCVRAARALQQTFSTPLHRGFLALATRALPRQH